MVGVTFSLLTLQRLDRLVAKGSHGGGRQEVIRHLVERGVREAMKDGFIPMEDD
ncbi:MAG: hypothetical protein ACREEW_05585 [Caulobacteraceae bacterium]